MDSSGVSKLCAYDAHPIQVLFVEAILDVLVSTKGFEKNRLMSEAFSLLVARYKSLFGDHASMSKRLITVISNYVDDPERLKNRCQSSTFNRDYQGYLLFLMKFLQDSETRTMLRHGWSDFDPSYIEYLIHDYIKRALQTELKIRTADPSQASVVIELPKWFYSRPGTSNNFLALNKLYPKEDLNFSLETRTGETSMSQFEVQEGALVEELLYAMIGIRGRYVVIEECTGQKRDEKPCGALRKCRVSISGEARRLLNVSLVGLSNKILPLCECYVEINAFMDEYSKMEYGRVAQALVDALGTLLSDYLILVGQLDHFARKRRLTLQKLWYYIQSALEILGLVRNLVWEISEEKKIGGDLLNLLYKKWQEMMGENTQELFLFLLKRTSEEYWKILKSWIYKGRIKDPYGEFLVQEEEEEVRENEADAEMGTGREGMNWKCYKLRDGKVPIFLESVLDQILAVGKYINVLRACGSRGLEKLDDGYLPKLEKGIEFDTAKIDRTFVHLVSDAYKCASGKLLRMLLDEYHLVDRLKAIKCYFLLVQGDSWIHFMQLAEEELKQPASQVSVANMQVLLDTMVRANMNREEEATEGIKVQFLPYNLVNQLIMRHRQGTVFDRKLNEISALEALAVRWEVDWPLAMVLNEDALEIYQILFRQLFYLIYVERLLDRSWMLQQLTKGMFFSEYGGSTLNSRKSSDRRISSNDEEMETHYKLLLRCFSLRQRMSRLIQSVHYYMIVEVIEYFYQKLEEALLRVQTVEELLNAHMQFLNECYKNCLLDDLNLVMITTKLLSICVIFCNYTERFIPQLVQEENEEPTTTFAGVPTSNRKWSSRVKENRMKGKNISYEASKFLTKKGFETTITRFENNFDKYHKMLIEATSLFQNLDCSDRSILSLNTQLDYNEFYLNRYQQI
ncbi:gamma-tubulin complex component 2-like [Schistocerca gregaria]|uniref:gamma-tubulin complex component 2-like n=1 Tax=Schistocerca gregaria TaxID=7010 RepID=UPI00211E1CC9|nr:gamma-tubulin complex component 2-like [Schistocerca gregaria]